MLVNNITCDTIKCAYKLDLKGDFEKWSLTYSPPASGPCLPDFVGGNGFVEVPNNEYRLYFCAESGGVWHHQGDRLFIDADDVTTRSAEW